MTIIFVTRHKGALEWARKHGIEPDEMTSHLDSSRIHPGDVIIGTLPVHVVAEVCARGGHYLHLTMSTPQHARGRELTAEDMEKYDARLEEFEAKKITGEGPC